MSCCATNRRQCAGSAKQRAAIQRPGQHLPPQPPSVLFAGGAHARASRCGCPPAAHPQSTNTRGLACCAHLEIARRPRQLPRIAGVHVALITLRDAQAPLHERARAAVCGEGVCARTLLDTQLAGLQSMMVHQTKPPPPLTHRPLSLLLQRARVVCEAEATLALLVRLRLRRHAPARTLCVLPTHATCRLSARGKGVCARSPGCCKTPLLSKRALGALSA